MSAKDDNSGRFILVIFLLIVFSFAMTIWGISNACERNELKETCRDLKETYTRYLMITQEELIRLRYENKTLKESK